MSYIHTYIHTYKAFLFLIYLAQTLRLLMPQGMPNIGGVICLKATVIKHMDEMASLLKIAFGSDGDAVMIQQKSPKEIKVTKVLKRLTRLKHIHYIVNSLCKYVNKKGTLSFHFKLSTFSVD